MKTTAFIFWIFIFAIGAFSKEDTCYTVQLLSTTSSHALHMEKLPKNCQIMQIHGIYTVRCGCYDHFAQAAQLLDRLREFYPSATVTLSYRYRFTQKKDAQKIEKQKLDNPANAIDPALLRLMYQAFIFNKDPFDALKVAKIALRIYPNDPYWYRKAAEAAQWSGHPKEALRYLAYLYRHKQADANIENEIYTIATTYYQYDWAAQIVAKRLQKHPDKKSVQELIYIYSKMGKPEQAAEIIEKVASHHPYPYLYRTLLRLYLDLGEMEKAYNCVKKLESLPDYDTVTASLIARFYFVRHDIEKAWDALMRIYPNADPQTTIYWRYMSDFGWYLGHLGPAAHASWIIFQTHKDKIVDIERLIYFFREKDPKRAMEVAWSGYKKFKRPDFFYQFADIAFRIKAYKKIKNALITAAPTLRNDPLYWIVAARLHYHQKQRQAMAKALRNILYLEPKSIETFDAIVWQLINMHQLATLKAVVTQREKSGPIPSKLYYTLASAHITLQEPDRAMKFMKKLLSISADNLDYQMLYATILQSQGKSEAAKKILKKLFREYQMHLKRSPGPKYQKKWILPYLNVASQIVSADQFQKMLQRYRSMLTPDEYRQIMIGWSLQKGYWSITRHFLHTGRSEAWSAMALALHENDLTKISDLLLHHLLELSIADAASAASVAEQPKIAQSMLFKGMENNRQHEDIAENYRQSLKDHTNIFDAKGIIRSYKNSTEKGFTVDLTYPIFDSMQAIFKVSNIAVDTDSDAIVHAPTALKQAGIAISQKRGKLTWKLRSAFFKRVSPHMFNEAQIDYALMPNLSANFTLYRHSPTDETIYLRYGGMKNGAKFTTNYTPGNWFFTYSIKKENFYGQDGVKLGDGTYHLLQSGHFFHHGYPDLQLLLYAESATYHKKESALTRSSIQALFTAPKTQAMPEDTHNIGTSISIGKESSGDVAKSWRPYGKVNIYYNNETDSFKNMFQLGVGGRALGPDRIGVDLIYSPGMGTVQEKYLQMRLRYLLWY